ncbi:MAG: protein translocase subunit SecD [Alphaproteobacteria bacterium]|nr:protein translocase subunit SecD [Alphaproteobacteria bacterium]
MLDFPKWKVWSVILTLVIGLAFAAPNFLPESTLSKVPDWLPKKQLNLGLDLRGGSHLLLEADTSDVLKTRLETLEESIRAELRDAGGGRIGYGDLSVKDGRISFLVRDVADTDRAVEAMRGISRPLGVTGQRDIDVSVVDGNRVVVTPTQAGLAEAVDSAMAQAVEVIRRLIDALGTREPTIIRQGTNRIVVQVPGLQDPTSLKALIGKTAKLEFKLVDLNADPADVAKGRAPAGSQILPNKDGGVTVVKRRAIITGDQLIDSQGAYDQNGMPVVSFRFDSAGGKRFARTTSENVGKPFAIILDNQVISAPNINEPILGGSGQISGNFTTESANELAIQLRSGKLPVELKVVEERTVGPDLGADSIRAGAIASIVSVVVVAVFMLMTYGRFGVYANVALILNVLLILAVMSVTGATLTLPGIAGLVLTIGAAVDANVLINERIREEMRKGRNLVHSIETGYREASRTIFDANVTNTIAAIVIISFGSGPIKGFGVVLTIGIVTSVFTAVTVTRLIVASWLRRQRPTALVL